MRIHAYIVNILSYIPLTSHSVDPPSPSLTLPSLIPLLLFTPPLCHSLYPYPTYLILTLYLCVYMHIYRHKYFTLHIFYPLCRDLETARVGLKVTGLALKEAQASVESMKTDLDRNRRYFYIFNTNVYVSTFISRYRDICI